MKIVVEFSNLAELDDFCKGVTKLPVSTSGKVSAKTEEEEPGQEKIQPKEDVARQELKGKDAEDLRVEVRKLLAQVNKKTGSNTASTWIKELTKAEKLTDVIDIEELLALGAKAMEVLYG